MPGPNKRSAESAARPAAGTAAGAKGDGSARGEHPKKAERAKSGARPAAAAERAASPVAGEWGQELGYPDWMKRWLPGLHDSFNAVNKYVSVPALRMGLGRYMSTPLMGYLMILRTRGRKSGEWRDAPLGYVVVGDGVYCIAGFGRRTHWLQNVLADPHVEVILPSRAFSGVAQEVTDAQERRRVLPALVRSMGLIAGMIGLGNPRRDSPDEIERKCEGMPLVRIRSSGIAAGPEDPGGQYWIVPLAASALVGLWWLNRRRRSR